ncbi:2-deoxy-5-keto-D-gluconate 6-phosphate aldolase domain-containing protein [Desertimonas flava]|uniref:2-deoxy-5-keto-D-gluconate 6-phosphate aldolase domain-containing protein n=1 Tax=Desertimonas flava TaxID=2064846 RepID=UPI000E34EF44|nr:DUF2090 domain-containing protein [Desertimonas flava]
MSGGARFFLAVDHRRSYEKLFGVPERVDGETAAQLRAAKVLVVEALATIPAIRPSLGGLGVLLDDEYGADAAAAAEQLGVAVAMAFERSAQPVLVFEHDDWRLRLDALAARDGTAYAKVLVRHRTDGDPEARATQLGRLAEIDRECRVRGVPLLLEVLTPYRDDELAGSTADELEASLRPRLVVDAIADIQSAGVHPALWKVEGVADPDGCRRIAAQARCSGDAGIVVLGAGASVATVNEWLRSAAAGGYTGFAVGRSIWADSLIGWRAGDIQAETARATIASRYLEFVDVFIAAQL